MSSFIQTLLSVLELHKFSQLRLADFTAGREFHPALKIHYSIFLRISCLYTHVNYIFTKKGIECVYDQKQKKPHVPDTAENRWNSHSRNARYLHSAEHTSQQHYFRRCKERDKLYLKTQRQHSPGLPRKSSDDFKGPRNGGQQVPVT